MLNRRQLLGTFGVGAALALTACDTRPGGSDAGRVIRWWDHFQPRERFQRKLFERFAKQQGGLPVEYTVYNPDKQGQALQLAKSSNQLPDVFTLAGVGAPSAELVKEGWFAPLELDAAARATLPAESLFEGLSVFDGKVYSFPVNSPKFYEVLVWYHRDLFARAGLDPDQPPTGYDEWRAAARAIRAKGGRDVFGWLLPLGFAGRIATQVETLAQAAGATAVGGCDFRTGQYVFHSDPYLEAVEFLLAMKRDGVLFPGSGQLDARKGRARWAAGVAGMFTDGAYCIGVVKTEYPAAADKINVAAVPTPRPGSPVATYQPPQGGTFWLSGRSRHVAAASRLMSWFIGAEHQRDIAASMAAPPYLRSAIDEADVHPTYRRAIDFFDKQVFLAPDPVVRNPAAASVNAEMRDVTPGLAEIVQGTISGDIADHRKALRTLSDKTHAERARALTKVTATGATVTEADFAFPTWQPARDFGPDSY